MNKEINDRIRLVNYPEAVRLYFKLLKILIEDLNLDPENPKLALTVPKGENRIVTNLNTRYVLTLSTGGQFGLMVSKSAFKILQAEVKCDDFGRFTKNEVKDDYFVYYSYERLKDEKVLNVIVKYWLEACEEFEPQMSRSNLRKFHNAEIYELSYDNSGLEVYLSDNQKTKISMDFFVKKDFEILKQFAGQRLDRTNPEMEEAFNYLKGTYEKVDYWANEVLRKSFPNGKMTIRKAPTNQANKFEEYQWARLYPSEELMNWKKLSYTLTFSVREDLCVKIDNVGLDDNDPLRKKYFEYRGEFFSSAIVKIFRFEELQNKNWDSLIAKSVDAIKVLHDDYNRLLGILGYNGVSKMENTPSPQRKLSINTILYGPPGTGKTFELNRIKEESFTDRGVAKTSEELLKEKASIYPFWKIFAAVLDAKQKYCSVAEIMSHPLVRAKISDTAKTPQNTIWRILQSYADFESSQMNEKYRGSLQIFNKNKNSEWSIIESKKSEIKDIIDQELLTIARNPVIRPLENETIKKRYNFITFHQKYGYEDFIEGIKPLLKGASPDILDEEEPGHQLAFELKKGIFYQSCLEAMKLAGYNSFEECFKATKEDRKVKFDIAVNENKSCFALFIDEINRANISAVFGELITLIEENKRLGKNEEMWLKLPYSNENFAVPPNLYLVGTMNTADRSIALLDIALRRRFEFVGFYPDYKLVPKWEEMLKAMNEKIFLLKKNPDFFIGHAFFIKKQPSSKADIFNTKIIPLLMEYFQNNTITVKSILKEAKVEIEEPSINNNHQLIAIN